MNKSTKQINEIFEKWFLMYKNHIYDYAFKMLGEKDGAGDIAQETFIRLYDQLKGEVAIENPKSWLFIISRNLCLNKIRSRKRANLETIDESMITYSDNPTMNINLNKALLSLDSDYREVIILKAYHGFSYSEISNMTGQTIPAVRSLLYKARNILREQYNRLQSGGDINELRSI